MASRKQQLDKDELCKSLKVIARDVMTLSSIPSKVRGKYVVNEHSGPLVINHDLTLSLLRLQANAGNIEAIRLVSYIDALAEYAEPLRIRINKAIEHTRGIAKQLNCTDPHPGQFETDLRATLNSIHNMIAIVALHDFDEYSKPLLNTLWKVDYKALDKLAAELHALATGLDHFALKDTAAEGSQIPDDLITQQQAAKHIGVTPKTIREYVKDGMPERRPGKTPRYSKREIWDWAKDK